MLNKYNEQELLMFYDEAPKTLNLNSIKMHFIAHERWDSDKIEKSMSSFSHRHSSPFISSEYRIFLLHAYDLIFKIKLDNVPLYINGYDPYPGEDTNFIVSWRLKIGI